MKPNYQSTARFAIAAYKRLLAALDLVSFAELLTAVACWQHKDPGLRPGSLEPGVQGSKLRCGRRPYVVRWNLGRGDCVHCAETTQRYPVAKRALVRYCLRKFTDPDKFYRRT